MRKQEPDAPSLQNVEGHLQTTQPTSGGAVTNVLCKLCQNLPPPAMGPRFTTIFLAGHHATCPLLLIKAGDIETNTCPTPIHKRVWICDICHKQIHCRKQIYIRCNRIEQWVHLRYAGIRQTQYTNT